MGLQLAPLLRQFDAACTAADDLAEAATAHIERHPDAEIITSFPGPGKLAGARVLAEIGDDRTRLLVGFRVHLRAHLRPGRLHRQRPGAHRLTPQRPGMR